MSCSLEIKISNRVLIFQIRNCLGINTFSDKISLEDNPVFVVDNDRVGITTTKTSIFVYKPNQVVYTYNDIEMEFDIPTEVASQFIDYVTEKGNDTPVNRSIKFTGTQDPSDGAPRRNEEEEENPRGGRNRKTRRNKNKCRKSRRGC
jgi:hypothetical protein